MAQFVTTAVLGTVSCFSLVVSPIMVLRPEQFMRGTGALGPKEHPHPVMLRFVAAFEMTCFTLSALALRACVSGTAADRVFWTRLNTVPVLALAVSLARFTFAEGHKMHGNSAGAKLFAAFGALLILGGWVFPETSS